MLTPRNPFKDALLADEPLIGLWLALGSPYAAELCATTGFDWLLVDGEHGPHDLRSILLTLQAVAAYDPQVVVRLPHGDRALIKQVLEIGATTLMIPMVESAEQARDVVRATRYPPHGDRGVGSGLARSSRWSSHRDYLNVADDRVCVVVQVESVSALAAVHSIAAVDGVDGVFVGAGDLAASMGHRGHPAHPEVREAVAEALAAIQVAGKPAGVLETNEELARHSLDLGARFVAVGTDVGVLSSSLRALSARFKTGSPAVPGGDY